MCPPAWGVIMDIGIWLIAWAVSIIVMVIAQKLDEKEAKRGQGDKGK